MSAPTPNIAEVVAFYNQEAKHKEIEAAKLSAQASRLMGEAKALRKLAQDTEERFPQPKVVSRNEERNIDSDFITHAEFESELLVKAGRVKHVAERLQMTEEDVRAFLEAPESNFYIGPRGWIMPKGHREEAA